MINYIHSFFLLTGKSVYAGKWTIFLVKTGIMQIALVIVEVLFSILTC